MLLHAERQALQTQIQIVSTLRRLDRTQVTHQLGSTLGDERTFQAKTLCVGNTVVAVIRSTQAGELIGVLGPIKLTGIHNTTAHSRTVTVHVLRGGMGNNIGAPLNGSAVNRCGKGVVNDERKTIVVGSLRKDLDIQHVQRRVSNGLTKDKLGIRTDGRTDFFVGRVRTDEGSLNAHTFHGNTDQVESTTIDCRAGHNVVTARADIEHCIKVCCLA